MASVTCKKNISHIITKSIFASEISWFHLPKILVSSLQLKLIGTARRWAQKRCKTYKIAKLIVHSIYNVTLTKESKFVFSSKECLI